MKNFFVLQQSTQSPEEGDNVAFFTSFHAHIVEYVVPTTVEIPISTTRPFDRFLWPRHSWPTDATVELKFLEEGKKIDKKIDIDCCSHLKKLKSLASLNVVNTISLIALTAATALLATGMNRGRTQT